MTKINQQKFSIKKMKRNKKNKVKNTNQKSFFFEDYLETNLKKKVINQRLVSEDRIYILFFFFLSLIIIFFLKITLLSLQENNFITNNKQDGNLKNLRRDIVDRNQTLLSRNIKSFHAGVRSHLVKDPKKLFIKLKIILPNLNKEKFINDINQKKFFYIKKRLTKSEKDNLWSLGEKAIIFEPYQARIYPHSELFSHILGQIDSDNYGVSGVEKFFDKELKDQSLMKKPLELTLDSNLQYIIKDELDSSLKIFKADGAAGLLLDSSNGEILSLVSLPDFNINSRKNLKDKNYMNKITKSIYELGSIFKTFTIALAIDKEILESNSIIENIPNEIKCSKHVIKDIKKFPKNLSVEDILVRSSNIGTLMIARKIGEKNLNLFLNKLNILNTAEIELDEVGTPLPLNWEKCKLETISYGHGITTTLLQAGSAYATLLNGGYLVKPTIIKKTDNENINERVISQKTSTEIQKILRKVVTEKHGTAHLADAFGYSVSGKTGTAQYYSNENKNINTFISSFLVSNRKYILLVMLDDPKVAEELIYDYRGIKIKGTRNEAGWNSAYLAGQIIKKIGPILAINRDEFNNDVVKRFN